MEGRELPTRTLLIPRRRLLKGAIAGGGAMLLNACAPVAVPPVQTATASGRTQAQQYGGVAHDFIATNVAIKIDPQAAVDIGALPVTAATYSGFLRRDPYDPSKIIGDLAQKWERVDSGRTVRFSFRKGVTWHDGTPFTADDVVFSLERVLDPKFVSPRGGSLLRSVVDGVRKVDDLTVDVGIKQPARPYDDQIFASPFVRIVSKTFVMGGGNLSKQVMGTGPFKLKTLSDDYIELARNDKYFIEGRPYLDGVIYERDINATSQLAGFRTGKYQISSTIGGYQMRDIEALKKDKPDVVVYQGPAANGAMLFMNATRPPFDNPKIRRAVWLAIDRKDFIARSGLIGVEGLLDSRLFSKFALDVSNLPGYRQPKDQDLAEARRLIAETNSADTAIEVLTDAPKTAQGVQVIAEQLRAAGFKNATPQVQTTAVTDVTALQLRYSIYVSSDSPPLIDPTIVLDTWYTKGAVRNVTGLDDAKIKSFYDASFSADEGARVEAIKQFQQYLADGTLPWVPLMWLDRLLPRSGNVRDYVPGPTLFDNYEFDAVWLAK